MHGMITKHLLVNAIVRFECSIETKSLAARIWRLNGYYHNFADIPAVQWTNSPSNNNWNSWYMRGVRHRTGGLPAIMREDGSVEYYLHNVKVTAAQSAEHKNDDE